MTLALTSSSFQPGDLMPAAHTCDGAGLSPPLEWSDLPRGTKSLALIVDDPDARSPGRGEPFVHWLIYNIQSSTSGLALGAGSGDLPAGATEGRNDDGQIGYFPPCPPHGPHRYIFRLYALDSMLPDRGAITTRELGTAMSGHVLATTELIAVYARQAATAREAPLPTD